MIKGFVKDTLKYLPPLIASSIVGLITIPIITREFPAKDYGYYSLVIATIGILSLMFAWITDSIYRFYPAYERDGKAGKFYSDVIRLSTFTIAVIVLVLGAFLFFIKSHIDSRLMAIMLVGIMMFVTTSIFSTLLDFLRSRRQVSLYSRFFVWKTIAGLIFGLSMVFIFKSGIQGMLWGVTIAMLIGLPWLWKMALGGLPYEHSRTDLSLARNMAAYGIPLVIGNLFAWIINLSDRYVLEIFRGASEVGIYSASYNIALQVISLIITSFMLASSPIVMHVWEKEGEARTKEFVVSVTRYYLLVGIPAVVGLSVLSKPIVTIMAGHQYLNGYKVIPFVALGVFILGLQQRYHIGFLLHKRTGFITLMIVLSGLSNLGLNLLLIPKYGYMAAAITTLVSYSLLLLLMKYISRRFFTWKFPTRSLINSLLASLCMGLLAYFIGTNTFMPGLLGVSLAVLLGVLVYCLIILLLGELQLAEKQALKQIINKYFHKLKTKISEN